MSRLFEIFTTEYVRLTLRKNNKQSIEHKGAIKVIESPSTVEGYFTEEDDTYYYLGIQQGQINIAVNKTDVSTMEIADPNDLQETFLEEFGDAPDSKKDMN